MVSNRLIRFFICLLLCVGILCVNVLGATPSQFAYYQLISLEGNTHTQSGTYVFIDDIEFLNYVTMIYSLNIDYEKAFYSKPFSVQTIDLYNEGTFVGHYNVICMQYGNFTPKVSGWVSLNGNPVELTIGTPYYLGSTVFPFASRYTIPNVHPYGNPSASYNFFVACDVDTNILCYRTSEDGIMDSILSVLNSIESNITSIDSSLSSVDSNLDLSRSLLNNIYNSLRTIINNTLALTNQGIANIYSTLISINSSLSTINNTITSFANEVDADFDAIYEAIEYDLWSDVIANGDTLERIESKLQAFSNQFQQYAMHMAQSITNIENDVDEMNDTLSDLNDHFNGESLKQVSVPGTGTNLWSIIWQGLQAGLSGLGSLFSAIFNGIGFFAQSASNGFQYFDTINDYQSVVYAPTDLTGG